MSKCKKEYAFFIGLPLVLGGISGFLNQSSMEKYGNWTQPPLSPPSWVFPVAWMALYILMGVGAAMVYCKKGESWQTSIKLFLAQLLVNVFWVYFFFTLEWTLFAFFWLVALLLLVLAMTASFAKSVPLAAKLQIPYILWLVFAGYLNLGIWLLNK